VELMHVIFCETFLITRFFLTIPMVLILITMVFFNHRAAGDPDPVPMGHG
jgi:hypothetical protein